MRGRASPKWAYDSLRERENIFENAAHVMS